ncbi:dynein regulatory complex subunit 7 [Linepithema humile]|uniref:dynein regulatory complex subunit 7 n=1 Tax=Linepithema humile TaxID=83485 RepID=UPI00351EFC8C
MGNSFECATLLVSLLLGQGYNAYVVSGYASREQVLCDMTRRICPYLPEKEQTLPRTEMPKIVKYQLKAPPDFRSQFLLELENRERKRIEDDLRQQEEERQRMIAEFEHPRPDKYFGNRIHAWVVILPEEKGVRDREITEPIFIEPSSGNSYNPTEDETNLLYLGVESVWNDQNYWINMQPREKSCAEIIWDLNKIELWEHLLPGEPRATRKDTDEVEEDIGVEQDKHLDMPASYVSEIHLNDLDFEKRYPQGSKTIFYKKAKIELFAPHIETDGLIQRVTTYEDYEYTVPIQSYENYLNRSDCLTESRKHFETNTVTDYFIKGRLDHCKTHRYLASGNNTIDSESVIDFYVSAQFDGLSRIEIGPLYLTLYYTDRDDFLYYRHVEYLTDKGNSIMDGIHFRRISKIVEKYQRNKEIPACKNIAEREFTMIKNEICIKFHYNEGQNSRATRTFIKPLVADRGDRLIFDLAMTHGYNPDSTALPEKNLDLFYDLNKHLIDEDYSTSCIRDAEIEIATFLKKRANENINPRLTISLFDKNRVVKTTAELGTELQFTQKDAIQNPLNPYFARFGNPRYISKAEEYLLRDECVSDFKEFMIKKASQVVSRIETLYSQTKKLQILLTQSEDLSKTEEEQMLAKINEMNFDIHVLETYLNRHRDMVSKKYRLLFDRLQQHSQLQVLQK